jgi:hypothetical protein
MSLLLCTLALGALPMTGHAGADGSCLARVSHDAWKARPLRVELEDGRRLVLDRWTVRTKSEAGIDTSGLAFGGGALSLVPATSIRKIDYDKRGPNWGGRIGTLVLGIAGVALFSGRHDPEPVPRPQTPDEALQDAFEDAFRVDTKPIVAGLVGGLVGYILGSAIFPPRAEPRSVACSPTANAIAIHAPSEVPSIADSAAVAAGSRP